MMVTAQNLFGALLVACSFVVSTDVSGQIQFGAIAGVAYNIPKYEGDRGTLSPDLYGDAVGGFAPIKDIYKTDVWALSRYRNALAVERGETPPIPERSITKEPSAELRPDQKDSDSLPDYPLLDQVLRAYVDEDHGYEALLADGFDPELVRRVISLVDKAEYKRRQYPPGTKVSARAFGKDRRLPMTPRWNES